MGKKAMGKKEKNQPGKRRQQEEEGDEDPKMVNHEDSQGKDDDEEMRRGGEESKEENEAMEHDDDEKEEEEEEDEEENDKDADTRIQQVLLEPLISDGKYRNKQRCLVLCSRGVTARYRHLLEDLRTLLPHHKKESKLDPGKGGLGQAVNDIAAMRGCNSVLFLECRKRRDCYMWLGHVGGSSSSINNNNNSSTTYTDGPSVKFHVTNVHTMDELRLTGNCMKGSRPILTFDPSFEKIGHLKLIKELFVDVFGTPRGHPKSKPFVDRIMAFYHADKRIWVRNYQIVEQQPTNAFEAHQTKKQSKSLSSHLSTTSLVEIGPRFVLNPIRIFRGSFGGQTLFQNPNFVSPNEIRAMEHQRQGHVYEERKKAQEMRKERQEQIVLPEDPLDSVFR